MVLGEEKAKEESRGALFFYLLFASGLVFWTRAMPTPFLPLVMAQEFGQSSTQIGMVMSSTPLGACMATPIAASLARNSRRIVYFHSVSLLFIAFTSLLMACLQRFLSTGDVFLAVTSICFTQGMAYALYMAANTTLISRRFTAVAYVVGMAEVAVGFGAQLGRLAGGALYDLGGFGCPFLSAAVCLTICGIIGFSFEDRGIVSQARAGDHLNHGNHGDHGCEAKVPWKSFCCPGIWLATFGVFSAYMTTGLVDVTLPQHLESYLGPMPVTEVSAVSSLRSVVYLLTSWLCAQAMHAERAPLEPFLCFGFAFTILGMMTLRPLQWVVDVETAVFHQPPSRVVEWSCQIFSLVIASIGNAFMFIPGLPLMQSHVRHLGAAAAEQVSLLLMMAMFGGEFMGPIAGDKQAWVAQNEIDKVASGVSSVHQAVKAAKAHVQESGPASCHPYTNRMAGYSGKNVSRDFWRFTSIPVERVTLKVPLKSKTISGGYELANVEVVDPISMVSYLWNDIGIRIGQDEVEQYWDHHRKFGARWALHSRASRQTMPLGLYGDSVKVRSTYLWLEKMVGIFLNCPLYRPRSCRCAKWLLFACQEELLYANHSLDCVYGFLTWSLNQLFTGRYPVRGFNGAALSTKGVQMAGKWICNDRWTFQITEIRGDWSWHKFVFRFKSSWKGGAKLPICFKCKSFAVGAPHELYYNIEENSPCWQKEHTSVQEFIADQCPDLPCPLVCLRYFHHDMIRWCSMHAINLGLCYGTNGGALMTLIEKSFFGEYQAENFQPNLDTAYSHFRAFCKAKKISCSQPPFTVGLVMKGAEAKMTAKASCGRIITEWLAHTLIQATSGPLRGDETRRWLCVTVNALARFFGILERSGRYLTATQAYLLNREGMVYTRGHLMLTEMFQRLEKGYIPIIPKLHVLGHLLKQIREQRTNIRHEHCFTDEDSMQWLKRAALRGHQLKAEQRKWCLQLGSLRLLSMKWRVKALNRASRSRI